MRGLILNNFYTMYGNIKLSLLMAVVAGAVAVLVGKVEVLPIVIAVQIFIFIANVGTSLLADETSKWNKYQISLPIRRSSVISAKYLSFLLLIVLGFVISGVTCIAYLLAGGEFQLDKFLYGVFFGLTIAISCAAFLYPAILKFGAEKSELFIFLSAAAANFIMGIVLVVLSFVREGLNFNSPIVGFISMCVSGTIFLGSYFLSIGIYKKQEL